MNDLQVINNVSLSVKEWDGKRVVTFKDIDAVHSRPEGTAKRNFRSNREHFIQNEDFFILNQPDEIRSLGIQRPQGGTPESVTLITESGYLMLVKSFTDDLAWKVQRELVNSYFRAKSAQPQFSSLSPQLQALINIEMRQNAQEERITAIEAQTAQNTQAVKTAFDTMALPTVSKDQWQEETNRAVRQMCEKYGLNYQKTIGDMYEELERTAGVNLSVRQKNLRERMKRGGATYAERQAVSKLSIVSLDKKLCEIYTGIVRRKAARLAASDCRAL